MLGINFHEDIVTFPIWSSGEKTIRLLSRGIKYFKIKSIANEHSDLIQSVSKFKNASFGIIVNKTEKKFDSYLFTAGNVTNNNQMPEKIKTNLHIYEQTFISTLKGFDLEPVKDTEIKDVFFAPLGGTPSSIDIKKEVIVESGTDKFKIMAGKLEFTETFQETEHILMEEKLNDFFDNIVPLDINFSYIGSVSPCEDGFKFTAYLIVRKKIDSTDDNSIVSDKLSLVKMLKNSFGSENVTFKLNTKKYLEEALYTLTNTDTVISKDHAKNLLILPGFIKERGSDHFKSIGEKETQGDIPIGHILSNGKRVHEFGLNPSELLRHTYICGSSGSGKTIACKHIVMNAINAGYKVLLLDLSKRSYRDLINMGYDFKTFTPGRSVAPFQTNFLSPPTGVEPAEWAKAWADVFTESWGIGEGGHSIVLNLIKDLYESRGIFNGSTDYPNILDFKKAIEAYEKILEGRESEWTKSVKRAVNVLTFKSSSEMYSHEGYPLEKLLNQNTLMELDSLGEYEKRYFVNNLLFWIYKYLLNKEKTDKLRLLVVIEEAHNIFNQKNLMDKESILDQLFRQIRELGVGFITIDQSPAKFSKVVLENTYTKIALTLSYRDNIDVVAKSMGFSREQTDLLNKLDISEAIVNLSGRIINPFLISIDNIESHTINDEFIARKFKFDGLDKYLQLDKANEKMEKIPSTEAKIHSSLKDILFDPHHLAIVKKKISKMTPEMNNVFTAVGNGEVLTEKDNMKTGISKDDFSAALTQLINLGFVRFKKTNANNFIYFLAPEGEAAYGVLFGMKLYEEEILVQAEGEMKQKIDLSRLNHTLKELALNKKEIWIFADDANLSNRAIQEAAKFNFNENIELEINIQCNDVHRNFLFK
ncbi:MAG: ATP-binding protein [Candidatus Diapherotrites archaeon]|nr:ATP-binding protein [Candidatus Diapherotrites archaeon]